MLLRPINVYLIIQNTTTLMSDFERNNEKYPKLSVYKSWDLMTWQLQSQMNKRKLHINLFEVKLDSIQCLRWGFLPISKSNRLKLLAFRILQNCQKCERNV